MLKTDSARNRLIGIGLISITFLCFAVLDTSAKWLVATLPVVQVVWLRFVVHVVFTAAILVPRNGSRLVRTRRPWLQLIRSLMLPTMTGLNFWALQYLQLAETGAIQFVVPILIALLGIRFGERLDAGRWVAIMVGFIGVLLIVRPGTAAFHPAILLSLGNAVLYASFNMLTRRMVGTETPEATQFLSALGAAVALTPFGLLAWRTPETALEWGVIGITGVAGGLGHWLLAVAHRFAPATTLGPFLYQQIIWMVLLGYLVFGDVPGPALVGGTVVVIASGLYLLFRERTRVPTPRISSPGGSSA
jgi:drug/metabolite transporter (DMT)-like permease